jgi:diguanylate cyclase (GGDEF)-like protein
MNDLSSTTGDLAAKALDTMAEDGSAGDVEVLVVEDDPEIGKFFQMKLAHPRRTIFVAETMKSAVQILEERDIALILLDLTLPDADGRSFLKRVRDNPRTSMVPVIVVSARRGPMTKSDCFDLGADEYFEKPVLAEVLVSAVAAKIRRAAELARRARNDVLTGALNRQAFLDAFHRTRALCFRNQTPMALAILDMDRFKAINDRFGHPVGDQVLIRSAQVIAQALRRSDVVGRWGGDEFVVLFPDTDSAGARRALDNVSQALREEPIQAEGRPLRLSFSAGIVDVNSDLPPEEVVAQADRHLYQAKAEKGRRIAHEELQDGSLVEKH